MKKQNLLDHLLAGLKAAVQYWSAHADSLQSMEKVYVRKWTEDHPAADYAVQFLINPHGQLYKITQRHYANGSLIREESCIATHGWQSSGHLICLGMDRYLVFDAENKQLLVEDWNDTRGYTLEAYEQL